MRLLILCTLLALAPHLRAVEVAAVAAPELRLSGFVDFSYTADLRAGDDAFHLDQVELDLERRLPDGLALRVDLESRADTALAVEQGWLALPLPGLPAWRLTAGKFNAPIGVELLDAPDLPFHSHSLLFDYGLPVNLTGAQFEGPLAGPATLKAYVVNGWDVNGESNASRSVGGRLGLELGAAGSLGLSVLSGREERVKSAGAEDLRVADLDYLLPLGEACILGAELNLGHDRPVSGSASDWRGWMLAGRWTPAAAWAFSLRLDQLADPDGLLFGHTGGETRSSCSVACAWTPAPGRRVLLEARLDASSERVYSDGDGGSASTSGMLALAFTQGF